MDSRKVTRTFLSVLFIYIYIFIFIYVLKFKAKVSLRVVLFSCCCVQSGYKARFICDVMLRNYTTHNPKVWPWCLWLVELPVNVPQHLQDIHSDPVQLWLWRVTARLRATGSLFCLWLPWEPAPPSLKDWNSDAVSTKIFFGQKYTQMWSFSLWFLQHKWREFKNSF